MLKASPGATLPALPPLRRVCAGLLAAALLTAGLVALLLWEPGSAQAQDSDAPPVVDNLRCIAETERVAFLWDAPEWSGGRVSSYDYRLALPNGSSEGGRLIGSTLVYRPGSYQSGQSTRFRVTTNYETDDGGDASSAEATLTCYIGGARPLVITPGNTTRVYGGTDAMSYTVSGLVDGDAAADVVSGSLGRAPGDDAGSYAINLGTLAVAPAYATKYALPDNPAATTYTITPKAAAYTGTVTTKAYDGTTTLAGGLSGGFAAGDIVSGDLVSVSGGSYAAADAGTGIAITGVSAGGADAGNYSVTFSVSGDITPLQITTISGVKVNARAADGTTDATFDTGSVRAIGVLEGELSHFRAGGLVVSGTFPSAETGAYDLSVAYSLQDHGVFKAGNYMLSSSAASATLHGQIQDPSAQSPVAAPQPAPQLEPGPTPTPAPTPQPTQAADDATLTALAISAGSLNFVPDTTAYAVDVPATVVRVTLTPAANHPNAAVTVNGGDPGAPVSLDYGENVINVVVTAVDGVATETYVVTVTRPRSENVRFTAVANLAVQGNRDLALTGLATPEGVAVYPEFRRDHYNYRLVAPTDLTELVVTGQFTTPYENVGGGKTAYVLVSEDLAQTEADWHDDSKRDPVRNALRELVSILHLSNWEYPVTFALKPDAATTAQIGIYKWKSGWTSRSFAKNTHKQVYTLTVTRGLPGDDDATLHDLTISKGTLDFDPDTAVYTVDVPYTTDRVAFTAVPFHPDARVTVAGGDPAAAMALDHNAPNLVNVVVAAPDGIATQTYAVTVNRTFPTRPNRSGDLRLRVQADSITVTWRGPGNGDPPDYYVARLEDADGDTTDQRLGADVRTATFENLDDGATYTVSVRSGNDGGASDWSLATTVVTGAGSFTAGCEPAAGDDYDADDDGLIEVCNLAQLNAVRFDLDGDGSASSSTIADAGDRYEAAFPGIVANGAGCPQSGCKGYELTADLDFDTNGNGRADAGDYAKMVDGEYVNDGRGWLPIGEYAAVFDGNGHTISNLHYRSQGVLYPGKSERRGLFNVLAETGFIRNTVLKNVNVSGNGHDLGGLVGDNRGTISNSSVTGFVSGAFRIGGLVGWNYGGIITDSYSAGKVSSWGSRAGGLLGQNSGGRIVRSWSTANVTATAAEADYVGGLVGWNHDRRVNWHSPLIRGSIVGSYATGQVSGTGNQMGGLAGRNEGEIFASYATGDVSTSGSHAGGLVGDNEGPISASYALGAVSSGGRVGGLVGVHNIGSASKKSHRCTGCAVPNVRPGYADRSGVSASYWSTQAPGQTATGGMHLDNWTTYSPKGTDRTTAELRQPTDYSGIYALWDNLRDYSGDSYAWDFGTSLDFPVLRDTGPSVAAQRAQLPDAPEPTEPAQTPPNQQPARGIDYDQDDDGLIEVRSLDQLHAIRYDIIGTGAHGWDHSDWPNSARDAYQSAYPHARRGMGCPQDRCIGYELMIDLDFDTNGNGEIDPGDHYWNGVHLPDDSAYCIDWYKWHPQQSVRETPGACDDYWGNDGEGWRPIARDMGNLDWHGVFEGNGHAIRNLYINTLDTPFTDAVLNRVDIYGLPTRAGDGHPNRRGIFNEIGYAGVVRNLRLENVNVSGTEFVGALAGKNRGIVSNVHVTGAVSGISQVGGLVGIAEPDSYIAGSSSRAGVAGRKATGNDVGGLAGVNHGVIQASYARGAVSGLADHTGGLVGSNQESGSIKASYATGQVSTGGRYAGGLVGDNGGSVIASYATGAATADGGDAGGLVGRHGSGAVTATYWDTQASGSAISPAGVGKTTAELQQPTGYAGIYAGWNLDLDADGSGDDPWDFGTVSQYPALQYGGASPQQQRAPFTAIALDLPPVVDAATGPPNQAPTVSGSLGDVTLTGVGGTQEVSLAGLFSDADNDSLTITARALTVTAEPPPDHDGASYIEVVTVSVAGDHSSLTLTGRVVGTATVTVTASDGKGGAVSQDFVATVEAGAPAQQDEARDYSELIARMKEWRDDPCCAGNQEHTRRWDRTLLAFGEKVADASLTPMTATEAQGYADRGWTRWVEVAAALRELESAGQQQQSPANRAPTVASAIADATIVNESGTQTVSLSGVFSDADNDSLSVTAASSDEAVATVSVASGYATLTVSAHSRGIATITATADDGNGGAVQDSFDVTVKAAPTVASAITDVSSLELDATQEVYLSGVFGDADGDALTITAASGDDAVATVIVASDQSKLTVAGVAEGTATITVTAQDTDGNRVSDTFDVLVAAPQQQQQDPANRAPTVSSAIADATIVNESGTQDISLSGTFSDADNDDLTITAASSDETKASVSVTADNDSLTVNARAQGTATVTVTAADGRGGTVSDTFTVRVKAAPVVASGISDVSGLEEGSTQDVSLSGVFRDADGDSLTITAASGDEAKATVTVSADQSGLTVAGVAEGTATITVTARDADGNTVSDTFDVSVVKAPDPEQEPPPQGDAPTGAPTVAAPLADISLEAPGQREISLSGVFRDHDGDDLTITAISSNYGVASMWVAGSTLTVVATGKGTATITVTAEDPDGHRVSDAFEVTVTPAS